MRFKNPQKPRGLVGSGTALADLHLPIRVNGDLALFQAIGALLLEWDAVDHDFVAQHTVGFEEWAAHVRDLDWDAVAARPGSTRRADRGGRADVPRLRRDGDLLGDGASPSTATRSRPSRRSSTSRCCRATSASPAPACARCAGTPTSRATARWGSGRSRRRHFLDALHEEFGFDPPREHGFDTVEAIEALRDGQARVFFGMGGNFVSAAPDTEVTEQAMRNADLTVHVSTKLNRSHVVHRPRGADPPGARAQRARPHRRPRPAGDGRGLDVRRARLAGPLKPASTRPAVRGRHRLLARAGHARRPSTASRGTPSAPTTRRSGTGSPAWCRAARRTTRRSTSRAGSCCRTRRATRATFTTEAGKAISRPARSTCSTCRRAAAAADAALPRPVQHHDLRPRRPLPRDQERPPGGVRAPRRHRRASACRTARSSTWSASGTDGSERRAPSSGSCPTTSRAAAPRRTTRRPTRWSRWIHGRRQQHPDLEVGDRPAREAGRAATACHAGRRHELGHKRRRTEAHRRAGAPLMSNLE